MKANTDLSILTSITVNVSSIVEIHGCDAHMHLVDSITYDSERSG